MYFSIEIRLSLTRIDTFNYRNAKWRPLYNGYNHMVKKWCQKSVLSSRKYLFSNGKFSQCLCLKTYAFCDQNERNDMKTGDRQFKIQDKKIQI